MSCIENHNNVPKIFVGNVPFICSADEFKDCFKNMEGYIDAQIINRHNSEFSRGFGFVTFNNIINAQNAIKNDIICKDRLLRFTDYNFENKITNKNYLFIRNIPKNMKREELANIFKTYGEVGACFIATNVRTGESKGNGVVEIIDDINFEELLNKKFVEYNNNIFEITRFKNKNIKSDNIVKPAKRIIFNQNTNKEIYKMAFNAGVNIGRLEGIQIAKNCFYLENEELLD